jgi:hypothetical protein
MSGVTPAGLSRPPGPARGAAPSPRAHAAPGRRTNRWTARGGGPTECAPGAREPESRRGAHRPQPEATPRSDRPGGPSSMWSAAAPWRGQWGRDDIVAEDENSSAPGLLVPGPGVEQRPREAPAPGAHSIALPALRCSEPALRASTSRATCSGKLYVTFRYRREALGVPRAPVGLAAILSFGTMAGRVSNTASPGASPPRKSANTSVPRAPHAVAEEDNRSAPGLLVPDQRPTRACPRARRTRTSAMARANPSRASGWLSLVAATTILPATDDTTSSAWIDGQGDVTTVITS